jgi:hypothetical protein
MDYRMFLDFAMAMDALAEPPCTAPPAPSQPPPPRASSSTSASANPIDGNGSGRESGGGVGGDKVGSCGSMLSAAALSAEDKTWASAAAKAVERAALSFCFPLLDVDHRGFLDAFTMVTPATLPSRLLFVIESPRHL